MALTEALASIQASVASLQLSTSDDLPSNLAAFVAAAGDLQKALAPAAEREREGIARAEEARKRTFCGDRTSFRFICPRTSEGDAQELCAGCAYPTVLCRRWICWPACFVCG